jgi:SNF2 family DNA or RNA helicase
MSVFESINADMSESDIVAEDIVALQDKRTALKDSIAEDELRIKTLNEEIERIKREAQEAMTLLATERQNITEKIWDTRQEIKRIEKEILNLEQKLRLLLDAERKKKEFQDASIQFDKETAGLAWREWAYEHQIDGARYMANVKKSILADKMGLGKSMTALIAADMLKSQRILIICPSDVVRNFEKEVKHWAPHRKIVLAMYKMSKAERNAAFELFRLDPYASFVVLINYEAWRRDASLVDRLVELRFDTVIMDEAHTIKDTNTFAFRGVEKIVFAENCCPFCSGPVINYDIDRYTHYMRCSNPECDWNTRDNYAWDAGDRRSVKNVFPMTGTPILNRPDELYPLLHLILPEVFYDLEVFRALYCEQDLYTGKWTFQPGAMDRLAKHLQGRYVMRNRNDAGVKIPKQEIVIHEIPVAEMQEFYPTQFKLMQMLTKHAQIVLESGKKLTAMAAITIILRKRQINVYPAGVNLKDEDGNIVFSIGDETTESIKLDKAFDLLTEITADGLIFGERAVVFSQFKPGMHALSERLKASGISAVVFDGATPESLREEIKADFNRSIDQPRKWQVVLANYKTGGVGLNFTDATHIIALDEEWNPGKNEQAWGRIDRIGQTQETTVHILRIAGTIDTWMATLNDQKRDIVEGFEVKAIDIYEAMKNGEVL